MPEEAEMTRASKLRVHWLRWGILLLGLVGLFLAFLPMSTVLVGGYVDRINQKMLPTHFQLDYSWSYEWGYETFNERFVDGWWRWTIIPGECDVFEPKITGDCGILEVVSKSRNGDSVEPSVVVVTYADAKLLKNFKYAVPCEDLAKNFGYSYSVVGVPADAEEESWWWRTDVAYHGAGIQMNLPGFIEDSGQNHNNLFGQTGYRSFVPKGGALVFYGTRDYMAVANPNAAVSYDMMKEHSTLGYYVNACVFE